MIVNIDELISERAVARAESRRGIIQQMDEALGRAHTIISEHRANWGREPSLADLPVVEQLAFLTLAKGQFNWAGVQGKVSCYHQMPVDEQAIGARAFCEVDINYVPTIHGCRDGDAEDDMEFHYVREFDLPDDSLATMGAARRLLQKTIRERLLDYLAEVGVDKENLKVALDAFRSTVQMDDDALTELFKTSLAKQFERQQKTTEVVV